MATEASQPLKISLPVSAALAQAIYNESYTTVGATALVPTISSITVAAPAVFTTSAAHNLANGQLVTLGSLTGVTGIPNGTYFVTVVSSTTFSVSTAPGSALLANTGSTSTGTISVINPAQYTFVLVNASGQADLMANQTDVPIGVLQNKPCTVALGAAQVAGPAAEIVVIGMTKVRAASPITLAATTPGNALVVNVTGGHLGAVTQSGSFVTSASGKSVVGQGFVAAAAGDLTKAVVSCVNPLPIGA